MALTKEVYLYLVIFFATVWIIETIIIFLTRHNVLLKLKSLVARKSGKVLIKYLDDKRNYYEGFYHIKENTISVRVQGEKNRLIGIDPKHIYIETSYGIRAVNCNEFGSYIVDGQKFEQKFLSTTLADNMVKKALIVGKNSDDLRKLLIYILLGIGIIGIVCIGIAFMSYGNFTTINQIAPKIL